MCYLTFTNTAAFLLVHARLGFLISVEPSWWSRGLVLLPVDLNSHHLQISQTISSEAKARGLTLTQSRLRQHRRSG